MSIFFLSRVKKRSVPPPPPTPIPPLRLQVSPSKLKVAFALAGVSLTEEEFRTLEHGFKSDRNVDMVRTGRDGGY